MYSTGKYCRSTLQMFFRFPSKMRWGVGRGTRSTAVSSALQRSGSARPDLRDFICFRLEQPFAALLLRNGVTAEPGVACALPAFLVSRKHSEYPQ